MEARLKSGRAYWNRWSGVLGACALAALAVYFLGGRFTTVRFDQERIEVAVEAGLIHVHGLYHYQNASPLPALLTLKIPFPVDQDHPAPDAFALAEVDEGGRTLRELCLLGPPAAPHVRLLFRPRESKWILLDYWQPSRVPEGIYILTTTRAWRRPIAQASFRLRFRAGCSLGHSNYPVTQSAPPPSAITYTFSRTNFYPDADWKFAWVEGQTAASRRQGSVP